MRRAEPPSPAGASTSSKGAATGSRAPSATQAGPAPGAAGHDRRRQRPSALRIVARHADIWVSPAIHAPDFRPVITARRSDLYGWAGYGYCPSHSRWYWGAKLLIICTCDGTVTGFGLANPKLFGKREQARQMLKDHPANRPAPGTAVVTDKGLAGEETETFFASPDLGLALIRPARKDDKDPRYFPNWLRQRVEAIIWTLKNQLGLERHGGRVPAGLWARVVQRLLALNACIWHNWLTGAPVKRSLIAYDH